MATTQPGGLYRNSSGDLVDANGKPAKKAGEEQEAGFDLENAKKADLIAEAERRGITVTRADGDADKEPTVEDYRAALK